MYNYVVECKEDEHSYKQSKFEFKCWALAADIVLMKKIDKKRAIQWIFIFINADKGSCKVTRFFYNYSWVNTKIIHIY